MIEYKVRVKELDKEVEKGFHSYPLCSLQYQDEGREEMPIKMQFLVGEMIGKAEQEGLIKGKTLEISVKLE